MTRQDLQAAGYDLDDRGYAQLARFVELLLAENRRVNLTGAKDAATVWRAHICDSLALWPRVLTAQPHRLLDLGAGGGLPGLPLACLCEPTQVTLLDATRKKVAALERIIAGLALPNAVAAWGRAETCAQAPQYRQQFDFVTARAVATLPVLIEYAAGFLRPGAECWFFKTPRGLTREATEAGRTAEICRVTPLDTITYQLPGDSSPRVLVGYRTRGA
jgi:16S rRNA (guanine527-N7)-methyltransferase